MLNILSTVQWKAKNKTGYGYNTVSDESDDFYEIFYILVCTDCLYNISKYEGVKTLWSGTSASLLLVSNPAIQFMVYEALKRNLHFLFVDQVSPLLVFLHVCHQSKFFIVESET